jgi:hypothetical protein
LTAPKEKWKTPEGQQAEAITGEVAEAQMHLSMLTHRLVLEGFTDEAAMFLSKVTANLAMLDELACDVRALEERLEAEAKVAPPTPTGPRPIDLATARVRILARRRSQRRRQP